ncbi:MAG: hypothetical protein ACC645_12480 [Pirellulales bacterium]
MNGIPVLEARGDSIARAWENSLVRLYQEGCDIKTQDDDQPVLNMNVRFRSNDAYKAAFMNIFALVQLQRRIAQRIEALTGVAVRLGRYCHLADSYHIYGSNLQEFEGRFLNALEKRTFEGRTMRYADVRDIMEEARPGILEKAQRMGANAGSASSAKSPS